MQDPTEFRERFKAYKEGKQVYKDGLPAYKPGKNPYEDSTDFITRYEGWSDTAYQKKGDVPTIGYGTTNPKYVKLGKITQAQGRRAMMEDLAANEPLLLLNIKDYDKLPDSAKTVLRDILYNVGQGNLFRKSPKFMAALNSGNYEEAARQMDWDNNKVGFGGAKKRNAARLKLFLLDLTNHNMIVPKKSELVQQLEEQPLFQPWSNYHQPDYSLNNPAPSSISSWNNAQGPSYTKSGLFTRRAFENIMNILPLIEDDELEPSFKNGKLPKYEDGNSPEIVQGAKIGTVPFVGFDFHAAQKAARNFLQSYLLSDGFKERLKRTRGTQIAQFRGSDYDDNSFYNTGLLYDSKLGPFKLKKIVYKKNDSGWSNNGNYDWDHTITVGPHTNGDYDDTIAHELGHVLDNSFISNTGMPYSEMIPLLRNNKQYLQKLKQLLNDEDEWYIQLWKTDPMSFDYIMYHDAMPEESYGDVISTRYWLDKHGIFDSKKANNIFTEDHYNQIEKNKDKLPLTVRRFFDNFSKEDYIKIINDVAYNNTNKNDDILYAKNGKSPIYIKPLNRGKLTRLKKRTGKSESELYNDGNPAHKKMVVFARNSRKWKH